jgi:NAD(P)-dependent dehydrogenase (short-subunit alcohol dehydrogenase family)
VWDEAIAVNLTGPMLASQRTIEYMIQRGTGGSLVHVSSAAGLRGDDQLTAYSVSKAGIFALSRQIAVQCGRFGIRSNVVAPGVTVASDSGVAAEKPIAYEAMLATSMLGRLGSPADQANAVLFLASDQSAFVTGTVLTVDGGLTSVQAWVPLRRLAAAELARLPRHGARARATLVLGSDSVRSYCR